jgi:hypothetical protein
VILVSIDGPKIRTSAVCRDREHRDRLERVAVLVAEMVEAELALEAA